jgi:hypothetical protein
MDDRVAIDELVLRIPGLRAEDARKVAADVARRVGRGLTEALPPRALGRLDVRLEIADGTPAERIAEQIADAILRGLLR